MAFFTIDEVIEHTGAAVVERGGAGTMVDGFCVDSRKIAVGSLFVAMPGERVDGNDFAAEAIGAGAACVCLTRGATGELVALARERGCALLRADGDDGEEFLLRLAGAWRAANPQWRVVGVTGSVGKTTTKDMVAAGVGTKRRVHATEGNLNSLIGLPLTLLSAPATSEVVVVEMGMNAAGEIARMSLCAAPDVAAITNVGTSHIGMLGGREAIARAKGEIVTGMSGRWGAPTLVLDASDGFADYIATDIAQPAFVEVARVGTRGGLAWADDVTLDDEGHAHFTLRLADGTSCETSLSVPGRHMVTNCLIAVAVASLLGVDPVRAASAIASMPAGRMRLEVVDVAGGPKLIDDTYNASPASMAAALDVLARTACEGRRVAVLGEMGELGGEAERLHALVGAYAAAVEPDRIVLVGGECARAMGDAACTMGYPSNRLSVFGTVDEAAAAVVAELGAHDVMLAKGSRSVGLDRLVREVRSHVG